MGSLGQEHRAELAGPHQTDPHRVARGLTFSGQTVQVHWLPASSLKQSSASDSMGAKSRWAIHAARLNWRM